MSDFAGDVATFYARYRRGYPPAVADLIADAFDLGPDDTVVDLGCGTGQLTLPLAARAGRVVGVDPEPDMLAQARSRNTPPNVEWRRGTDADLPDIAAGTRLGAVTAAVAIHWMDRPALFRAAHRLVRPGGGVAVVTNGTPLWRHDTDWSRAARDVLEDLLGHPVTATCDTDAAGRRKNTDALREAGFDVDESTVDYHAPLTLDALVGGLYSAMSTRPPALADRLRQRVGAGPWTEHVTVHVQLGRTPRSRP